MRRFRNIIISILYKLFWIFPVDENKIVFESFWGVVDHDSPGAIYRELVNSKQGYKIIWLSIKGTEVIPHAKIVRLGTLSELYHLSTAKVWVDNCRKPIWLEKRKKQLYIQTWHGGFPVKKSEGECADKLPEYYIDEAIHDSSMIDYIPTNSKLGIEFFKKNFWYKGNILYVGLPRSDVFHRNNEYVKDRVYKFLSLDCKYKLLLYAPTFRNDLNFEYNFDYAETLEALNNKFGGEWKILIKSHPNSRFNVLAKNENVIDCSDYNDINDLIIASSLFVSDYSSCIFDAVEANVPVILFATDYASYLEERGMNFTYEEFPFPYGFTFSEFLQQIKEFDMKKYNSNVDSFVGKYGVIRTSEASKRVAEIILKELRNDSRRRENG